MEGVMANNYTMASFAFDCGTPENAATVIKWAEALQSHDAGDDETPDGWESIPQELTADHEFALSCTIQHGEPDLAVVYFYHDESIDLETLANIMHIAMKTLPGVPSGQGFGWADACSKPRTDEFGGGAMWITSERIESTSSYQWLDEMRSGSAKL
jgi:hypothetical protein